MKTARIAAILICAALAACARPHAPPPEIASDGLSPSVLLTSVPFHPQTERDDCGPAALAMMLAQTGIDTDPKSVAPAVYTPGLEGTLQADIVQAARRSDRLALPVRGFQDLLAELDAGHPVLVLQNLGLERFPIWHYAVAIGYDLGRETLVLHSGRTARLETGFADFDASWRTSKRWALTISPPDRLSATAGPVAVLDAANGLERAGRSEAAALAYGALLERWPDNLAALMGFGNARYAAGDVTAASKAFRHAVALDPASTEAWNNLAVTLGESGRRDDALKAAKEAVRLGGPHRSAALETLAELESETP